MRRSRAVAGGLLLAEAAGEVSWMMSAPGAYIGNSRSDESVVKTINFNLPNCSAGTGEGNPDTPGAPDTARWNGTVTIPVGGGERGWWQVCYPGAVLALGASTLPTCSATSALNLPAPLAEPPIRVSCTHVTASASVDERGLKLASYRVLAVASVGSSGSMHFVQRQFETRATVCENPGGTAARYAC